MKSATMNYDYGTCHVCGGQVEERTIDHSIHDNEEWLLIRGVPTGVCKKCGEQILRWNVAERLEQITRQRRQATPTEAISVPVFPFA